MRNPQKFQRYALNLVSWSTLYLMIPDWKKKKSWRSRFLKIYLSNSMEIESIFLLTQKFRQNTLRWKISENQQVDNNSFWKQIYNGWKNKYWTLQWNFGQVWRIHENDWGDFIPLWNWHPMCHMLGFTSNAFWDWPLSSYILQILFNSIEPSPQIQLSNLPWSHKWHKTQPKTSSGTSDSTFWRLWK